MNEEEENIYREKMKESLREQYERCEEECAKLEKNYSIIKIFRIITTIVDWVVFIFLILSILSIFIPSIGLNIWLFLGMKIVSWFVAYFFLDKLDSIEGEIICIRSNMDNLKDII